jgi:hypothetical protein
MKRKKNPPQLMMVGARANNILIILGDRPIFLFCECKQTGVEGNTNYCAKER